ncbi:FtsX-like permease family protein [Bacteriovoracaceae bacterium]|nr:FtsX-like permease family protein [Bacteriovoracaceae bacterium]
MVNKYLIKSLLRELLHLKSQILSISLIVGIGVGVYFGFSSTHQSLLESRDHFYQEYNFPHLFAHLHKTPNYLLSRIKDLPGVKDTEGRIEHDALLTLPKLKEPGVVHFVSLPNGKQPNYSKLFLLQGRLPSAHSNNEVVISESFFLAHNLKLGDKFSANINGSKKTFVIRGVGVTPEHIIALQPGSSFPDDLHFTIAWVNHSALAPLLNMSTSFNSLVIQLNQPHYQDSVKSQVEQMLERYGLLQLLSRDKQMSAVYVREELKQLDVQAKTIPIIFFLVAAFILNIVISRLIRSQRTQIATLKSLGIGNYSISTYYFCFSLVIVILGTILGFVIGSWIGRNMVMLYGYYYHFPILKYKFTYHQLFISLLFSVLTAFFGTTKALKNIFRLSPAEALKPPTPINYKNKWLEKSLFFQQLAIQLRMIVRGVITTPIRSLSVGLGLSFAVVLLILGLFWNDSLNALMFSQFGIRQKETGQITLSREMEAKVVKQIERFPGILMAEGYRSIPVKIKFNNQEEVSSIKGFPVNYALTDVINETFTPLKIPKDGFHISKNLAQKLSASKGDILEIELLEGRKRKLRIPILNIMDSFYENQILTSRSHLAKILQTDDLVNSILFRTYLDPSELYAKLKNLPAVTSITYKDAAVKKFQETSAKFLLVFAFIFSLFAAAIGFGITYNNLRVTLAERDWELSTMMILGFRQSEVFKTMAHEITLLLIVFVPVGWVLGFYNARWILMKLSMEEFPIPFSITSLTFLIATFVIVMSTLVSYFIIYNGLKKMDLVATLKSRG